MLATSRPEGETRGQWSGLSAGNSLARSCVFKRKKVGENEFFSFFERHTCAGETVAFVTRKTGAEETAQRVGAVGEHVAWPVLALVLVCSFKYQVKELVEGIFQRIRSAPIRFREFFFSFWL